MTRAVGLLADDDVALLRAQDMHGLGAVGRDAALAAHALPDRLPHRRPKPAGTLISKPSSPVKLTRKRRARDAADLRTPEPTCAGSAAGSRLDAADERGDYRRARGPCTAMTAHCSVTRGQPYLKVGPLGLEVILHVVRVRGQLRRSWS